MVERSYVSCIVGEDSNATYHTHTSHKRRSSPLTKKKRQNLKKFFEVDMCMCMCVDFCLPPPRLTDHPHQIECDNLPCDKLSSACEYQQGFCVCVFCISGMQTWYKTCLICATIMSIMGFVARLKDLVVPIAKRIRSRTYPHPVDNFLLTKFFNLLYYKYL